MNFRITPSLQNRSLVTIAIALWSQDEVKLFCKKSFCLLRGNWQEIEEVIIEKSSKLPLPEMLKQTLLGFIVPIGQQMLSWLDFHQRLNGFVTELPDKIFWTPTGTIDKKKTAENLVKDGSLGAHERFKFACIYCLEDDIRELWETFELYDHGYTRASRQRLPLVSFWSLYIEGDLHQLENAPYLTPYEYAFKISAIYGYETATRYFLQKLNLEGDDPFIMDIAKNVADNYMLHSDVLLFLLSRMNAQQQLEIFKSHTYAVLKCFLVWPWCSLFLDMAKCSWDILSKEDYRYLLEDMVYSNGYKYYLQMYFEEFWLQSPEIHKQFVIDGSDFGLILQQLHDEGDGKNIKLICKGIRTSGMKRRFFDEEDQGICELLICYEMWDLIEPLFLESVSSRLEIVQFREQIETWRTNTKYVFQENCQWDKFFQLVDNCIHRFNKRICIESSSITSKRQYSEDVHNNAQ